MRRPNGQFEKGEHWREPRPFREKDWLVENYIVQRRSTGEIAAQFGTTDAAILFWLRKHGVPRRTISEARGIKHWGACALHRDNSPDMPFHIHHVVSFADKELRAEPSNLVLLCEACRQFVHSRENLTREYLSKKRDSSAPA